ncbi:28S ribosomal protein S9, mitochondrial [Acipenser ruthenus]|uniref:Small ribosomal subunit protein uS9m n=1 Tax=Acipenser ruthenus TaxID=7906 RepID=A0A444UBW3_ACIRT|nr:28S ribosomal protein S9, mitochondrial [Acipenser ruthenus]
MASTVPNPDSLGSNPGRHLAHIAKVLRLRQLSAMVLARLVCTSSTLQRKNIAAAGPEKYTQEFIKKQIEEFNIGKRHLANMMGEDPETFTQEGIDRAIAYLFPSGLFEKRARPVMKHPDEIFPKQRAVQWGEDGRPFHFLFYTGKQSYYSLMHCLRFIQLLERILALPYCSMEEEYIQRFRRALEVQSKKQKIEPLQYDENEVAFSTGEGRRKTATATTIVRDNGSGNITVNGVDYLHYFPVLQDREQLMFPFQFLDRLGKHDMECKVTGGGRSAQAGAIRLATARALLSFVTENEVESMRQAGLLTPDPRVKERQKPGQEGARRKFTWNKR